MVLFNNKSNMKYLPIILIISRLLIGFLILCLSYVNVSNYSFYAITLFTIGLLTDVFDGIIARKLNISTVFLRRMDSTVDQFFYVSVALACYIQNPTFFTENGIKIMVLLAFEAACYVFCFLKFKKEIATHSIGAKFWSLILFALIVQLMWQETASWLFEIFFWTGILTRIEILLILIVLKSWMNDIPSIFHALIIRKGKAIKRNKLFNG
jgi:phosphatidylglycerophosphate synthase